MGDVGVGVFSQPCLGSHGVCRTREGRLWLGLAEYVAGGINHWQVFSTYSDDNGASWSAGSKRTISDTTDDDAPSLAVDGGNNIHMVWRDATNNKIYYQKFDGGGWCSPAVVLITAPAATSPPRICIDSTNRILVVTSTGTSAVPAAIRETSSTDSGKTWSAVGVGFNTNGCIALCADVSGYIHAVYTNSDGARNQVYYDRWESAGTWTGATAVTASVDGNQYTPDIAVDTSNALHVTWVGLNGSAGGKTNLRYRKYSGGWGSIIEVYNDASWDSSVPSISCADTGYVYITVVAYDYNLAVLRFEIQLATSSNGGTSFGGLTTISDIGLTKHKNYPAMPYQRWPWHSRPDSGYACYYVSDFAGVSSQARFLNDSVTWKSWGGCVLIFAGRAP